MSHSSCIFQLLYHQGCLPIICHSSTTHTCFSGTLCFHYCFHVATSYSHLSSLSFLSLIIQFHFCVGPARPESILLSFLCILYNKHWGFAKPLLLYYTDGHWWESEWKRKYHWGTNHISQYTLLLPLETTRKGFFLTQTHTHTHTHTFATIIVMLFTGM